ncbi:uncharacterized protein LOC128256977 [Drosophila gunungcola]|uniref:Uncharacterized protein n=1 Tax=Drosophila gunungcola TaxID=103775 RepID=A0A9P9YCQ2_9MUSC|nr:uncharacterized protein LOC128256977 [Drosophila gunungcola]KAI8034118.1 hypothetical protein M5D96_013077 [Drosophila gunungcola]
MENLPMEIDDSAPPIHEALINYAATTCRLFYIHDASAWKEWTTNTEYFQDLSADEVCHIFLTEVLPNLETYELSESIKNRFKLLEIHPLFRRVAQGYQYTPDRELASRFVLQKDRDYCLIGDIEKPQESQPRRGSHTVLLDDEGDEPKTCVGYKSKLSQELAAIGSAILSTDLELANGQMLDVAEIHRRLRCAKQNFEDKAILAPLRTDIDDMINKLTVFDELKAKFCRVVSDCKKYA